MKTVAPLISIIIPLYNLEQLIGKCIQSTRDQDLQPNEYEVIVVNDGSTDNSYKAALDAAQGSSNVHIFTKANEGLGSTRNYGTDRATGRYVMYLDADDYLTPNVLRGITETMEREELDMLSFDLAGVDEQGQRLPLWCDGTTAANGLSILSGKELLRRDCFLPMVWVSAYNREFLNRHALRMAPIWHEDEEFTPRALYFAAKIRYYPLVVYNYLQRSDSFMQDYNPANYFEIVKGMKSLADFAAHIEPSDTEGAQLIRWRVGHILFQTCKKSVLNRSGNTRQIIARCHQLGLFPLSFRQSKLRHKLLNFSPLLFNIYYLLHKQKA
ncbi:MAG: glycosyltransferase [Alistipes sp.]